MRKLLLLIIPLFLLFGCTNSEPFYLDDELYNSNELIDIKSDELEQYLNNDKSFGIYIYTPGCFTCYNFESYLKKFQTKYNISFYRMDANEMKKTEISEYIKYSPTIVLYNKGKMVSYLDAESNDDKKYYESVDGFYKWFTKYVNLKEDTTTK